MTNSNEIDAIRSHPRVVSMTTNDADSYNGIHDLLGQMARSMRSEGVTQEMMIDELMMMGSPPMDHLNL